MIEFEVQIPNNCSPRNLGFATTLVEQVKTYTSDEVNLKVNGSQYINAKSILGLLSLNYDIAYRIKFQIIGENENYTSSNLHQFIDKLIKVYSN